MKKLTKAQQIDYILLDLSEGIEIPSKVPQIPHYEGEEAVKLALYREYWYEKGRKSGIAECRVRLREAGLA